MQEYHVFLLRIECADGCKPGPFPLGKSPAQSELLFNVGKVSCQIAHLFSDGFVDVLRRFLTTAAELKMIPVRLSAVGA